MIYSSHKNNPAQSIPSDPQQPSSLPPIIQVHRLTPSPSLEYPPNGRQSSPEMPKANAVSPAG
jgi:hypothetical protein